MAERPLSRQAPDPGQLVRVRGRQWVVSETRPELTATGFARQETFVTLQPVDDDFSDRELRVVWELEPGAVLVEKAGLPKPAGHDTNRRLDDFLNALRWGVATNIDRKNLLAPFRSGIDLDSFQFVPLMRAVEMARANLLIADDVGLGKTIEAGLVIQELILRHRARTVLVVCPSAKQIDWQNEMREKFGLDFRIVNSEMLRQLRRERGPRVNPWSSFPRLIASMDWIKQGVGRKLLRDVLPPQPTYPRPFDILVVDEAQNVAPSGAGNYAMASLRTQAVRMLAPHFTHHLFLSATPHNGYRESFTALLELLDDQRFARTVEPDPKQLRQVMVRRLKRDIKDREGKPFFPERALLPLEVDYTDEERDIHATLDALVKARLDAEDTPAGHMATRFVLILLKKRLFSSPAAFASTLAKVRRSLEARRSAGAAPAPSRRDIRYMADLIETARENAVDEEEADEAASEVIRLQGLGASGLGTDERALLDKLSSWAERNASRADSKAKAILRWIEEHLRPEGQWNNERLILFTEFRDTQAWLQNILAANGMAGNRLALMHGSQTPEEREAVKAAFQASPEESPVRILLATDSASEGINLQNHCRYLIHVEIPWNPNVMEQRNGRIDRHGQRHDTVSILHPVGSGYRPDVLSPSGGVAGDAEYLLRTAQKVEAIRADLGAAGQVLADEIERTMLGQRRGGEEGAAARQRRERAAAVMKAERDAASQRAEEAYRTIREAMDSSQFSPPALVSAVQTALELAHQPPLEPGGLPGAPEGSIWRMPHFGSDSWSRCEQGLDHPFHHKRRPVTFDAEVARGRDDVVLQHLGSPLVQMSLRLLREELWKVSGTSHLHRIAVRALPGLGMPALLVHSRLVVTGGDHRRIHEELVLAGGRLGPGGFLREENGETLKRWLESSVPLDGLSDEAFARLAEQYNGSSSAILSAVEARSAKLVEDLNAKIARRCENEKKVVGELLDDLKTRLESELAKADQPQVGQLTLPGLTEAETQEVRRDVAALEARLARIPEERRQEIELVERHYRSPDARTFPAAVVFLVPDTPEWRAR